MKYESILMILIFLFYQVSLAQNMLSDYNLEQRAFVYDIWTFDSLVAIKSPNINHPQICIEKKNLSLYADKDSSFYSFWEFYPNSYLLMGSESAKYIDKFVMSSIEDSVILKHWKKEFYPNGGPVCVIKPIFNFNNGISKYHNLNYKEVLCNTFLVILVPYKQYFYHVDYWVESEPPIDRSREKKIFMEKYSDGLYVKMLYPLFMFEED